MQEKTKKTLAILGGVGIGLLGIYLLKKPEEPKERQNQSLKSSLPLDYRPLSADHQLLIQQVPYYVQSDIKQQLERQYPELAPKQKETTTETGKTTYKDEITEKPQGIWDYFKEGLKNLYGKEPSKKETAIVSGAGFGASGLYTGGKIITKGFGALGGLATGGVLGAVGSGIETFMNMWDEQSQIETKAKEIDLRMSELRKGGAIPISQLSKKEKSEYLKLESKRKELIEKSRALGKSSYKEIVGKSWTRAPIWTGGTIIDIYDLITGKNVREQAESWFEKKFPKASDWFVRRRAEVIA